MQDEAIYEKVLRVENKDVFIDLKSNKGGVYLKISERKDGTRNSILIPASGIKRLVETLQELSASTDLKGAAKQKQSVSPMRQESDEDIEVKKRSCYVGNLSWEVDENQLSEYFSSVGTVNNAVILRRGKRSLGSGIVEFADAANAKMAISSLNNSELDGRKLLVREDKISSAVSQVTKQEVMTTETASTKKATKSSAKTTKPKSSETDNSDKVIEPNKVFVQNLTWQTTDEEVVAAFCAHGSVSSVEIRTSRSGRSLGSAVVEFENSEDAQSAIKALNGQDLNGREILVREYYQ